MRVQNKGVPAVIVAYGEFERAARNQLKLMGLPDQPVIVLPGLRVGATAESADIAFQSIAGALIEKVAPKPIA